MIYAKQALVMLTIMVVIVACGTQEKTDTPESPMAPQFSSLAAAKQAGAEQGKPILASFYTDW